MKKLAVVTAGATAALIPLHAGAISVYDQIHKTTCSTSPALAGCTGKGITTAAGGTTYLQDVLSTIYMIAGIVAVIFIIIGGIKYITSTGDPTRIQTAKNTVLYAVMGLIVVVLAQFISGFVIHKVTG